jgi:hypothetical protein
MRAIVILSTLLLLGGCSNLLQSSRDFAIPEQGLVRPAGQRHYHHRQQAASCARHRLLRQEIPDRLGPEYKEASGSAFVSSYSITTDQGQLHVDDAAVYHDIMLSKGKEIPLQMSAAAGGWIVDLPGDSNRSRIRSSVMCHPLSAPSALKIWGL